MAKKFNLAGFEVSLKTSVNEVPESFKKAALKGRYIVKASQDLKLSIKDTIAALYQIVNEGLKIQHGFSYNELSEEKQKEVEAFLAA